MTEPLIQGIDLFCGAGGLSLGLQQAGINIVLGIDNNPACKWAYEHNIHAPFLEASVRDVEAKDLNKVWADAPYRLLAGCAPCQPFSQQRRGRDTSEEEAWDLLDEFGRLVRQTRPEFVTMENVAPLRGCDGCPKRPEP